LIIHYSGDIPSGTLFANMNSEFKIQIRIFKSIYCQN
jgi:hypothetical protein